MINRKMKLALVIGFMGLTVLLGVSISTIVFAVLIGLLFIPPILLFASVFMEGIQIIVKKLKALLESGKEFFVISISEESITLEPQFR